MENDEKRHTEEQQTENRNDDFEERNELEEMSETTYEVSGEMEKHEVHTLSDDTLNEAEKESKPNESKPNESKPNKPKTFIQMIVASMIGSVFTFAMIVNYPVIIHNDFINKNDTTNVTDVDESSVGSDGEGSSSIPTMVENITEVDGSLADMVEEASQAIVGIVNYSEHQNPFFQTPEESKSGAGSGVIFKKEDDAAYIVTNNHVIENASKIEVSLQNGEMEEAELVGTDALTDIAVLKINSEHVDHILPFGNSDQVRAGDVAIAIGNPLGLDFSRTVTKGIISAMDRSININTSAGKWDLNVIQTDAAINPGNSGGPLLSLDGKVIGINSLKIASSGVEGLGFAIPSNDVVVLVDELIKNSGVERPFIGIGMVDLNQVPRMYLNDLPNRVTEGVVITSVEPDSAAHTAGMQEGDVLVKMDDIDVSTTNKLRKYLYTDLKVGDQVTVELYRGEELIKVQLELTSNLPMAQ